MKRGLREERWTSAVGGVALAALGAALTVTGSRMAYRAARGSGTPVVPPSDDAITAESAQSFPASDAPSWTGTRGTSSRPDSP
jgi:hypothetical protein